MVKVVGAVCVLLGGLLLGRSIERKYAYKIDFWQEVLSFFTFCKSEIETYGADLDDICKKQREHGGRYASMIADAVQYNKTTDEGGKMLVAFAAELRETGLTSQQTVFTLYCKMAEQRLEKAKEAHLKKGKPYFRLIPILVIGVVVFFW